MITKLKFTDGWVRNLKPAQERTEFFDTDTRGLGLRVNTRGNKTFFLLARFPGSTHPTRRTLFEYSSANMNYGLSAARAMAAEWREGARRGIDVRSQQRATECELESVKLAEEAKESDAKLADRNTYEYVVSRYFEVGTRKMREGSRARFKTTLEGRAMRKWGGRNILSIQRSDVKEILEELRAERKFAQGYNAFAHLRAFFNWAISADDEKFNLPVNPCNGIKVGKFFGVDAPMRDYTMSNDEIRAVWRAIKKTAYPAGPLFELLFLSMQRRNEVADAVWDEFDFEKKIWTIPAERMKNKKQHIVPLPNAAWDILEKLPRFNKPHLFSAGRGKRGSYTWERAKKKLAKLALIEMQEIYKERGIDPANAVIGFKLHDLRRAGRSGLSALRIPHEISERVVLHLPPKLTQIYDKHGYELEKREALQAWENYLLDIVEKKPSNVHQLRASA